MITIEELSAYNRKLVDMNLKLRKENENLKKRNSDEECLKRLAKKGYIKFCAKANEWHKVACGDLPKNSDDEKLYLVYWGENDYGVAQFNNSRWWSLDSGWFDAEEVIAWCEIPQYTEE